MTFCPYTILSISFCPYHFVLEPECVTLGLFSLLVYYNCALLSFVMLRGREIIRRTESLVVRAETTSEVEVKRWSWGRICENEIFSFEWNERPFLRAIG